MPLEKLFDNNDVSKNPKVTPNESEVEDCNIGTEENPKVIKLSKYLSPNSRGKHISLMKEFSNVFA